MPRTQNHTPIPRLLILAIAFLCIWLAPFGGCTHSGIDGAADKAFAEMLGSKLNKRALIVTTDKHVYHRGEDIHFWIENRTSGDLWFPNEDLLADVFAYDAAAQIWIAADLGYAGIIENEPRPAAVVPPGVSGPHRLPVSERVRLGQLRLLFVGSTDGHAPGEGGDVYAAYVDVSMVEESK